MKYRKKSLRKGLLMMFSFLVIGGIGLSGCSGKMDGQSSQETGAQESITHADTFEIVGGETIPINESSLPEETPDNDTLQAESLDAEVESIISQSIKTASSDFPRYVGYGLRASHTHNNEFKVNDTYKTSASYASGYVVLYVYFKEGGRIRKAYYIPNNSTLHLSFNTLLPYGIPDRLSVHHYAYYGGWRYLGNAKHSVAAQLDGFKIDIDEEGVSYEIDDMLFSVDEYQLSIEGDTININRRTEINSSDKVEGISTAGLFKKNSRWPNGKVEYYFHADWTLPQKQIVRDAMKVWENGTGIRFVFKPSGSKDYKLKIQKTDNLNRTIVGYSKNAKMRLKRSTIENTDREAALNTIYHELGHVLGLKHEQQRRDRDYHIDFHNGAENKKGNKKVGKHEDYKDEQPYNIDSIMHYESNITRKDGKKWDLKRGPNASDFKAIRKIYDLPYPSNPDKNPSPIVYDEFLWSYNGGYPGMHCVKFLETSDPQTWDDNQLCSKEDFGFRWGSSGPQGGGIHLQIKEPSDPHTWNDNWLSYDANSKYEFHWGYAGKPTGMEGCIPVFEPMEENYWNDNYFCWKKAGEAKFKWSSAGEIEGMHCTQWIEPSDPHTWDDNYLCTSKDIGMQWSYNGEIPGMRNTQTLEGSDPHTWDDNYMAVPHNSPYTFAWGFAGPLSGYDDCIHIHEGSDPDAWHDNFLCYNYNP